MYYKDTFTPEKRQTFLETLSKTANVTHSCDAAGISRMAAYNARKADDAFRQQWDEALESGNDSLEDEAVRRGHYGYDEPVYQGGQLVGHTRKYSDTLLIFMLKSRRPEKFKDRVASEVSGPGGGPIEVADDRKPPAAFFAEWKAKRGAGPESTE